MIEKIAQHFKDNFYPDIPVEEIKAHLEHPEVLNNAMTNIALNGHDDSDVLDIAKKYVQGKPTPLIKKPLYPENIQQATPNVLNDKKAIENIFNDYPGIKRLSKPEDYLVQDASGKMKDILNKNNFKSEFQPKGQTQYKIGNDKIDLNNGDKHRIYINNDLIDNETDPSNREDAIRLEVLSHAFHDRPEYNKFTKDLEKRLIEKYGKDFVENNDGVDAYVRGHLSSNTEYKPYRDEMKFLPKNYFNTLDDILNGNSLEVKDNRLIDGVTGYKMSDLNRMHIKTNPDLILEIAKEAKKQGVDPYTALAVSHQETGISGGGTSDQNTFHLLNDIDTSIPNSIKILKQKLDAAKRAGKKTEAEIIQSFNGYGKVGNNTEGKQRKLYGLDVSKEPIDMNKNPVYGKRVLDIRENILKKNPEIRRLIQSTK